MKEVTCPKCSTPIPVRVESADDRGRVRLSCRECSAKVLIKVNKRALKLSPDIPQTELPPEPPLVELTPEQLLVWAVVVYTLDAKKVSGARRALLSLSRFRSNPNKLHDVTDELPFVIGGLKRTDAAYLEEEFDKLGAECETGPHAWLLDEDMVPVPPDERGRLANLDPEETDEVETAHDDGELEVAFDFEEARTGTESWLAFDEEPESLPEGAAAALDTSSSQPITAEVLAEEYDSFSFSDFEPSESFLNGAGVPGLDLPDTEESLSDVSANPGFPIVTVGALPGMPRVLGGVMTRVVLRSTEMGDDPDGAIGDAMAAGRQQLQEHAEAMGASAVVGTQTTQSAVPGSSGWLWILVLSGTAVGP